MKPTILVSKCLGFDNCRFDGAIINDNFVKQLKDHVNFITICPEVEMGLSTPREAVRIVIQDGRKYLISSNSGIDYTEIMNNYSETALNKIDKIDGAILKNRSPSCGFKDVKTYPSHGKVMILAEKSAGFFGGALLEKFPNIIIEDEGRLKNLFIREHFLTAIFTIARFNEMTQSQKAKDFIDFHSQHKYLFMAYSPNMLKKMGKLVAQIKSLGFSETSIEYDNLLKEMFHSFPISGRFVNAIDHIYGYFSKTLAQSERDFFQEIRQNYIDGKIPLSVIKILLKSWSLRFEDKYIEMQYFFNPFPEGLINLYNSGK